MIFKMIAYSIKKDKLEAFKYKVLNFFIALIKVKNSSNYLIFTFLTVVHSFFRTIILWNTDFLAFDAINAST